MRSIGSLAAGVTCALVVSTAAHGASADESIIKNPGDHPDYRFEAEPHGLLGFGGPFEASSTDFGAGFRGTIILMDNGFVKSINDSVGIGFGGDLFFRHGTLLIPVVMQWNFWLSTHWSVFGEPGVVFHIRNHDKKDFDFAPFTIYGGGRYHFSDTVALTMRIGYPAISVGVSFFF